MYMCIYLYIKRNFFDVLWLHILNISTILIGIITTKHKRDEYVQQTNQHFNWL